MSVLIFGDSLVNYIPPTENGYNIIAVPGLTTTKFLSDLMANKYDSEIRAAKGAIILLGTKFLEEDI